MRLTTLVTTTLLLATGLASAWAQGSARDLKRRGTDLYEAGRFAAAAEALERYRAAVPDDPDVWYPLAVSRYRTNDLAGARTLFEGLLRAAGKAPDDVDLYLGRIEHYEGDYAAAAARYKRYLGSAGEDFPLAASLADDIRRAGVGAHTAPSSGAVAAYAENLGAGVNSAADDFHPLLSPNFVGRMYFATTRTGVSGGRRDAAGRPDPVDGEPRADMYAASVEGGRWSNPESLSEALNGPDHEVALDFADSGRVLVFWRGRSLYAGDLHVDTFRAADSLRTFPPVWADAPLDARRGDKDPQFFNDTTVLFAADVVDGGYGGFDLYVATRGPGGWRRPVNLGPTVNSPYDERTPFLAADGRTLYFSSNRADASLGGFDVMRAGFDDLAARWSAPRNAGPSINTAGDELHFRLSRSGLEAYYDSDDRATSLGGRDLYAAYLKEPASEQLGTREPESFVAVLAELERQRELAALEGGDFGPGVTGPRIPVSVTYKPLPYGEDGDAGTNGNLERARSVLQFLEAYPQAQLVITAHSDDSDPERFRTYFGMKRAERFAQFLAGRGIAPERMQLVSVGAAYPMARNYADGEVSSRGRELNRRLELHVDPGAEYALEKTYDDPVVPAALADDMVEVYRALQEGLVFRIEVAEQAQRFDDEAYRSLPAPTMQSGTVEGGPYRYGVGAYATYTSAAQLAEQLRARGFADARVVAYLNGVRLDEGEVGTFADDYPELAALLAAGAEPTAE